MSSFHVDGYSKELSFYGLNGLTTKSLPFIHYGFPPKQKKKILLRSYHHPAKRDVGLQLDVKFPVCNQSVGSIKTIPSSKYVTNNKACWKLRGINPGNIFTIQRNKIGNITNNSFSACQVSRPSTSYDGHSVDGDLWKFVLDSVGLRTNRDICNTSVGSEGDMAKALTERLDECDEELGVRQKKVMTGRKLGNVLSKKRLDQILKNDEKILPDIFYKTHV